MYDINCPCCGTTYQSSSSGFCDCCGYEFTEDYISEFIAAEKRKEKEIQDKIAEEERQQTLLLKQQELEQKQKEDAERKSATAKEKQAKRDKIKNDLQYVSRTTKKYIGIAVTFIFVTTIFAKTIIMGVSTGITAGWIFFIILAVASVIVSGFCYGFFQNDKLTIGFTNLIPSGIVGAFALACIVSDLWMDMIVDMFSEGFLVILFTGLIVLVIFLLFVIIALALVVGISQVLPAFLQTALDDLKGGLAGLAITIVAALLYLSLFEQSGLNIVLYR